MLGSVNAENGKYDEAMAAYQKAAAIDPFWSWGLGIAYALAGRKDEARAIAAELEQGTPLPREWSEFIDRFARKHAGLEEGAPVLKGYIRTARGLAVLNPWGLAELHAALGERDKAFRWLEAGIEQRQSWMPYMGRYPNFRSLRQVVVHAAGPDDPRFRELLGRMNVPQ